MNPETLLASALRPETTPFDYIVIGSGAGGGPLAARLAEEGCRVLLLEAGVDALTERGAGSVAATVLEAPLLHGKSVEDPDIAWDYRVHHYADPAMQSRDTKSVPDLESADHRPAVNKPRSAALGGCTAHHAMITAYGCEDAWEAIRDLTGDDGWHPDRMRLYFRRIENCEYRKPFTSFGRACRSVAAFFAIKPQAVLQGEHGEGGWLNTVVTDPHSAIGDHELLKVLAGAFDGARQAGIAKTAGLTKAILKAKLDQYLDVNDASAWPTKAEGVRLIPLGVKNGKRHGVRERLLDVASKYPDRLVISTAIHVTKLIFAHGLDPSLAPRVIGVEWTQGRHLYKASPLQAHSSATGKGAYYARREIIVCAGSFNTPQLLMLSGIGPRPHLEQNGINCRVDLPGVGSNLQDRYEVSVISELTTEFSTLTGVNFDPKDKEDEQLKRWRAGDTQSLYSSNGGALAILKKTDPALAVPDIFMFAAPAMFRGYYPGWSEDLLRRPGHGSAPGEKPDVPEHRNQLSWIILKARTNNMSGTVRLRSNDPFATPIVTHHHFGEGAAPGSPEAIGAREDLTAMARGVAFARSLNRELGASQKTEYWPGPQISDDSEQLEAWVRQEAWGHHPCGTCRIGADAWQPDPAELKDKGAVLDSKLRVHGVRGLRVVDASVFPRIPGYFIVTPIYCVSEKAADDILQEIELYPRELEMAEAAAIAKRREIARRSDYDPGPHDAEIKKALALAAVAWPTKEDRLSPTPSTNPASGSSENEHNRRNPLIAPLNVGSEGKIPQDTVGLALSGGGIRSATFCLGILQGLAALRKLRKIDFVSTASGGGFIASFVGRLFHRRLVTVQNNPAVAVEQVLRDNSSAPLLWLRSQADYIASGPSDDRQNMAVYLRNLFTLHAVIGVFLFAIFGVIRGVSGWLIPRGWLPGLSLPGLAAAWTSPWIVIPVGILFLAVIPLGFAYWAAPRDGHDEAYNPAMFRASIAVLLFILFGFVSVGPRLPFTIGLTTIILALLWVEGARFGAKLSVKVYGPSCTQPLSESQVVRNRLTRALGESLALFGLFVVFIFVDMLARYISLESLQRGQLARLWGEIGSLISGLYALTVFVTPWVKKLTGGQGEKNESAGVVSSKIILGVAALLACIMMTLAVDTASNSLFDRNPHGAWLIIAAAFIFSAFVARAFSLVNNSSLHATYSARLTRTFLGASNPERIHSHGHKISEDIKLSHPEDDLPMAEYQPALQGGPLHIINTCLNETVDYASLRDVRGQRGLALSCGPCGISLGRHMHALWDGPDRKALRGIQGRVDEFDAFRTRDGGLLPVEPLTLGTWTAISGAAVSTGAGREGSAAISFLAGMTNLRLGYWWDTNPENCAAQREFWPNLWVALKRLPWRLFRVQNMLFRELSDSFHGPHNRLWYLSDGGHFDNSAAYELIRRRLPFIIACDAGADVDFSFENTAQLVRLARIDFGADIEFIEPGQKTGWARFEPHETAIPLWIRDWLNPAEIGSLSQVSRLGGCHASLARISYAGGGPGSIGWLLFVKSGMTHDESLDVLSYALKDPRFPNHSTLDQNYDATQWECYRCLGEHVSRKIFR